MLVALANRWSVAAAVLCLAVSQAMGCSSQSPAPAVTVPPGIQVGIPAPEFGLNETVEKLYGSDDYYTHYVDQTHPSATDTDNPNGTPQKPRLTIPNDPPAGSVVEIHGGPYTGDSNRRYHFSTSGTTDAPIFIRGRAGSPPEISAQFTISGSYLIVENLLFDQHNEERSCFAMTSSSSGAVHHVAIRNSELRYFHYFDDGSPIGGHNSIVFATDASTGYYPHHLVVSGNQIHHNGTYDGGRDVHAVALGNSEYVWILGNDMHHNAADSVQLRTESDTGTPINHVYIGGNTMHSEGENAVDLKRCTDVVVSGNTMYDFQGLSPGNSGLAAAMVVHMGGTNPLTPKNILIANNYIYNVGDAALISETDSEAVYFVGNVVHNVGPSSTSTILGAVTIWSTGSHYLYNNLFYDVSTGVLCTGGTDPSRSTTDVKNNVFVKMRAAPYYHFYMGGVSGDPRPTHTQFDHNLLFQDEGAISIAWYENFDSLTDFQTTIGQGADCQVADPLFVDAANGDFHLRTGSPAAGAGVDIQADLQTVFGIDQLKDLDGRVRPSGAWDIGPYELD